jgi:hypothetical protein
VVEAYWAWVWGGVSRGLDMDGRRASAPKSMFREIRPAEVPEATSVNNEAAEAIEVGMKRSCAVIWMEYVPGDRMSLKPISTQIDKFPAYGRKAGTWLSNRVCELCMNNRSRMITTCGASTWVTCTPRVGCEARYEAELSASDPKNI